jgi:hypothetical protein
MISETQAAQDALAYDNRTRLECNKCRPGHRHITSASTTGWNVCTAGRNHQYGGMGGGRFSVIAEGNACV